MVQSYVPALRGICMAQRQALAGHAWVMALLQCWAVVSILVAHGDREWAEQSERREGSGPERG